MAGKMGRMTKRNRTKYRRRASAAGMARARDGVRAAGQPSLHMAPRSLDLTVAPVTVRPGRGPRGLDGNRAA